MHRYKVSNNCSYFDNNNNNNNNNNNYTQTTALLRSARIFKRVLETWGELLSLRSKWKTIIKIGVKNLQRVKQ